MRLAELLLRLNAWLESITLLRSLVGALVIAVGRALHAIQNFCLRLWNAHYRFPVVDLRRLILVEFWVEAHRLLGAISDLEVR